MNFSVLMSVYYRDVPEYLDRAILSVFDQTLPPSQLVIVCDGLLTGELYEVIERHRKSRTGIDVVAYDENKGLGLALNTGLAICAFDLVARADSDDVNRKYRFEKQMDCFLADVNLTISGGKIAEFENNEGETVAIRQVPLKKEEVARTLKWRNPFNHMTVMFRKSEVLKAGGYRNVLWFEDWDLWIRLLADTNRVGENVEDVLVDVRVGNGMLARRRGSVYFERELVFVRQLMIEGYLKWYSLPFWAGRLLVRFLPLSLLKIFYRKIAR